MTPLFTTPRTRVIAAVLAVLLVGYTIYNDVRFGLTYYREMIGPGAPKPPVYGIWDVESLTKNGADQPPLMNRPPPSSR